MGLSNAVIPVLPELAAANHSTYGTLASSLLFSSYFIGALLTMLPFGFLADVYDYLKFIVLAIILTFVAGAVLIVSNNLYLLIIARFLEGSACGAFFPAAYAMLSEYKEKNRYIGELNFLLNAGLALGVAISGYLAQWSIRGGIFLFTIMAGILTLSGIFGTPVLERQKRIKQETSFREMPKTGKLISMFFHKNYTSIWVIAFSSLASPVY